MWNKHEPLACPNCKAADRFVVMQQHVSVSHLRMSVRTERIIVVCDGCKEASELTRQGLTRYRGTREREEPQNGQPAPPREEESVDTDLPKFFGRGRR